MDEMGYMAGTIGTAVVIRTVAIEDIKEPKDLFNKAFFLCESKNLLSIKKDIEIIRDRILEECDDAYVIFAFALQIGFATNTINEKLKNKAIEKCSERQLQLLGFEK
jgi:hypothetical protein